MKKLWILLLAAICLCTGCTSQPLSRTEFAMDTWITLTIYDTTDSTLMEDAFRELRRMEELWSRTRPGSDVARLSQGECFSPDPDTYALLETALDWCRRTQGALDITFAPVTQLWDFSHEHAQPPQEAALSRALQYVGYTALALQDGQVCLPEGAGLDLGAVAKGAAADALAAFLRERGVHSALLNLGGNVYALGSQPSGEPWRVGVQDPNNPQGLRAIIPARDLSVVTSGTYQRNFTWEGRLYHHVLNPSTGYPAATGLTSVTILSPSSLDGDALSTACMVMGEEKAMDFVEQLEGIEALFIREDGSITATSGIEPGWLTPEQGGK